MHISFIFHSYVHVCLFAGAESVNKLSVSLCQHYERKLFYTDEKKWSPVLPKKVFIPPVLVVHRDQYTKIGTTAIANFILTGGIDRLNTAAGLDNQSIPASLQRILDASRGEITQDLTSILNKLEKCERPKLMLIEGAPGMGKSTLLNEIAYRWSKKQILKSCKLVFSIHLGNPLIQQASDINHLLPLLCNKCVENAEMVAACSKYVMQNSGADTAFLIDGFDECSAGLQRNGLIADLLQRKVLPDCTLVVASRPHASLHLRQQASITVDILGFADHEKMDFTQQVFDGQPKKIETVSCYLKTHCKINSLCYIPFYMSTLIFLYNQEGFLPDNPTELYESFVCLTLRRHIVSYSNFNDLNNLPNPYNKIFQCLCKLSLKILNSSSINKLITYGEFKTECPDVESVPQAVNGLGFLQAVYHDHYYGQTEERMYCYYLHSSIPEFLANHFIANLADEELKMFEECSYGDVTFDDYVALTKG